MISALSPRDVISLIISHCSRVSCRLNHPDISLLNNLLCILFKTNYTIIYSRVKYCALKKKRPVSGPLFYSAENYSDAWFSRSCSIKNLTYSLVFMPCACASRFNFSFSDAVSFMFSITFFSFCQKDKIKHLFRPTGNNICSRPAKLLCPVSHQVYRVYPYIFIAHFPSVSVCN